jgi:hypothetical protein
MSIQNNTVLLNTLLEKVNNLPEATTQEDLTAEIAAQNDIIAEQDAKIAELAEVLAGKASGSGNVKCDTCTVKITANSMIYAVAYLTSDDNGNISVALNTPRSNSYNLTCLCNSFIVI